MLTHSVASFTDAWIETCWLWPVLYIVSVASFTDAWIETNVPPAVVTNVSVASFTDAWIETPVRERISSAERSHLLQMRGLKQVGDVIKTVSG